MEDKKISESSSVKDEDKEPVSKIIDDLYKEYIIHEQLPIDFQIGMQRFIAALKSKLLIGHASYDGKLDTLEAINKLAEVARKKKIVESVNPRTGKTMQIVNGEYVRDKPLKDEVDKEQDKK